uniref:Reverse transcriptase zinc-binding domain-containing protein n=1 Tax=Oryza brachyantha TaxID=4533 RepID=J3MQ08_ORYBR
MWRWQLAALPSWVVKAIDKKRRAFLWTNSDSVHEGQCKVSWANVYRLKVFGGLGIPNLRSRQGFRTIFVGIGQATNATWRIQLIRPSSLVSSSSLVLICSGVRKDSEIANHIRLKYVFARQNWLCVLSVTGWASLSPPRDVYLQDWCSSSIALLPKHLKKKKEHSTVFGAAAAFEPPYDMIGKCTGAKNVVVVCDDGEHLEERHLHPDQAAARRGRVPRGEEPDIQNFRW